MLTLPKKPKIIEQKGNQAVFEIEACYPGYGVTLGNAFRRVLLSSLSGAAVTGVKIKGIQHEFSTIPHVIEDVVQIILNLKQIRFKLHTDQSIKFLLKAKGEKEVKAKDIKITSEAEIINKDIHIATLTDKKAELEMEIEVESGLGYLPTEQQKKGKLEVNKIAIDAIFSPVLKVNSSIENMRVGEKTNYDRLRINIETDGTITPKEAFLKAAKILVDSFEVFTLLKEKSAKSKTDSGKKTVKVKKEKKEKPAKSKSDSNKMDISKIRVEDLKISSRTRTVLNNAGLKTVAGLVRKKGKDLEKIEGMGSKGIVEIKRALGKIGLTLKL
ncbi:MAG: DNA-directed RNA polymerase subunit alpha [Parcubacteria group bacterium]|nr:DNA-directed RNA polymerase subunit alpha [Parcubacteria group bacterium]